MAASERRTVDEITKDLEELESLRTSATRDMVKRILDNGKETLEKERKQSEELQRKLEEVSKPKPSSSQISGGAQASTTTETSKYFKAVTRFGWTQSDKFVSIIITEDMEGVGELYNQDPNAVNCEFTVGSFDLKIYGLKGKNYRLYRENLENEIIPQESKFKVKQDKVTVMLKKKNSYDHWTELVSKRKKPDISKDDPSKGIMVS